MNLFNLMKRVNKYDFKLALEKLLIINALLLHNY